MSAHLPIQAGVPIPANNVGEVDQGPLVQMAQGGHGGAGLAHQMLPQQAVGGVVAEGNAAPHAPEIPQHIIPPPNVGLQHVAIYEPAVRPRNSRQIIHNNPANDFRFIVRNGEVIECPSQALCAASKFIDEWVQAQRPHTPPGEMVELHQPGVYPAAIQRIIDHYILNELLMTNEEALLVVHATQTLGMRDLERIAINHFQQRCLPQEVLLRYQQARDLDLRYQEQYAKGLVEHLAAQVLRSDSIIAESVKKDTLKVVFRSDRLNLTMEEEELVFDAQYKWVQKETGMEEPSKDVAVATLGDLLKRLRPMRMSADQINRTLGAKILKQRMLYFVQMNKSNGAHYNTGFDTGDRIPIDIVTKTVTLVTRRKGTEDIEDRAEISFMLRFDLVPDLEALLGVLLADVAKPNHVVLTRSSRAVHGFLNYWPAIANRRYVRTTGTGEREEVGATGTEVLQPPAMQMIKFGRGVLALRIRQEVYNGQQVQLYYVDIGLEDLAEQVEGSQAVGLLLGDGADVLERFVGYVGGRDDHELVWLY